MKTDKQNLKGFKTLWVQFDNDSTEKHQLFFKEHAIRRQEPEHPRGRTLFLLNAPPYATSETLQNAFGKLCGNVDSVTFTSPKGFKAAYIVFHTETGLENALELPSEIVLTLNTEEIQCLTGLAKWCKEYNERIHSEEEIKKDIENYMNDYDNKIADRIAREKAAQEAADADDGWVTVTGQKKRGQFALSRKESTINKVQQSEEVKNKKKQLVNFYTFQIRESKKQNLAELRKKYELDKQRLQELKAKRTFKPF